ncbi:hypothetical protein BIW11_09148 [Tropilaelaps mercedesae]|uniref:Uncharacterized protein n=1 Tax=Tropilaelaps mercedesae TaxID=418985 RepID=A0A1V9XLR1_9ACAR|nr:hypothetical protein BIW11_09148 [Tropilaelaps mercedesae]
MRLRALVPPRATCGEAVAAIRQDARRSLEARCGMHCEDLELIEDEQHDPSLRHELPKRVFLRRDRAPSSVPFCDYVYHGEDPADCLLAFHEILGLDVQVGDTDQDEEASPAGEAREAEEAAQVEEMIQESAKQLGKDPASIAIAIMFSVCVALLAVFAGYFLLRK